MPDSTCPHCGADGVEITRIEERHRGRRYVCPQCSTQWWVDDEEAKPQQGYAAVSR